MTAFMTLIERFKLSTKLVLGFSVGILAALAIGLNALASLAKLEAELEAMYEKDLLGISYIKNANLNLTYMSRSMRHMLIAQDDATRDASLASIKRARERLMSDLAEARKRMYRAETIARYEEFQIELTRALEAIEQAIGLIQREKINPSVAAQLITSQEFLATIAAADKGMHDLTLIKEKAANASLDLARENAADTRRMAIILLAAGITAATLMGILIGLSIQRPYDRLRKSVEGLAEGKTDDRIPHADYPNEIGIMARAIAVLQGIYRQSNAQHWVKSRVSEISADLQRADDFRALAQTTVSKLAPITGAGHGALYVADADDRYSLLASYGYRERKHLNSSFAMGEGLVGQCAMEKAPITLTAPKDYIRINSGLGEGPPAAIVVLPVIHGDRVLGVLEMASFQAFGEREYAVLDALLPILATSMEILDRNQRTRQLLESTQEQAVRMEKQAAQLEEMQVEMEAQQAELMETENWFRSIIENSPDGMLVVDESGIIVLANPQAEKLFGFAPGELVNSPIEDRVPERHRAAHPAQRHRFMAEETRRAMSSDRKLSGIAKDGREIPLRVFLSMLPTRGKRGRCVSVSVRAPDQDAS